MPDYKVRTAADLTAPLQREAKAKCSSTFTELARNEMSITYERRSIGCRADYWTKRADSQICSNGRSRPRSNFGQSPPGAASMCNILTTRAAPTVYGVNLTESCPAAAPCAFSRWSKADLRQHQFSQEFQAVGSIGSVDYVAGLYYFTVHVRDDAATPNSVGAVATLSASVVVGATYVTIRFCTASTPLFVGTAVNGCAIDRASEVFTHSYAGYGQATWNATEALHITVGGRYTNDKKRGVLHFSRNINYDDPANAATLVRNGYVPLDKSWSRFNLTATITYDFSQSVHGYAKSATGYRAGGASSRTSNYQAFNPEDVKSYEVGLKADFWDRRARFNIAGYIMQRKDSQVDLSTIQPTATGNFNNLVTFNATGTTKIRGIEADLTIKPIDRLTLNASYAYTYTDIPLVPVTYREFTSAGAATGNTTTVLHKFFIVFTPRRAASGSIDYELPIQPIPTSNFTLMPTMDRQRRRLTSSRPKQTLRSSLTAASRCWILRWAAAEQN